VGSTYDADDLATNRTNLVRFLTGDIDVTDAWLQDEEIEYICTLQDGDYQAAAMAARRMSAIAAGMVDKTVGPLSRRYETLQQKFMSLAKQLDSESEETATVTPIFTSSTDVDADGKDSPMYFRYGHFDYGVYNGSG